MNRLLLLIPLALVVAVVLTACGTTSATVPKQLLTCTPQPPAPSAGSQRDVGLYVVDLAAAGADCRSKLGAVRGLLGDTE